MRPSPPTLLLILTALLALVTAPLAAGPVHLSFGITVGHELPREAGRVRVAGGIYYVFHGSYYRKVAQGFVLVPAPLGARVRELPRGAIRFAAAGADYYRHAGVCYRPLRRGYEVCAVPPAAAAELRRAETGGDNQVTVRRGRQEFVFRAGVFLSEGTDGWEVETTPVGAIAREFPPDAMSVWFNGTEYFEANGVFFREVPGGFEVTSAPWPNAWEIVANR